ncbi:MAG: hypothetical protein ABIQ86_02500 [Steroidobacteraceae bacterium]
MAKAKQKPAKTADQLQRFKDIAAEVGVSATATLDKAFGKIKPRKPPAKAK